MAKMRGTSRRIDLKSIQDSICACHGDGCLCLNTQRLRAQTVTANHVTGDFLTLDYWRYPDDTSVSSVLFQVATPRH